MQKAARLFPGGFLRLDFENPYSAAFGKAIAGSVPGSVAG